MSDVPGADELDWLTRRFESHRTHLEAVARRILGSASEAQDAVQGTWLRLVRADSDGIDNLVGWLTTAVAREALDMLRARVARREQPLDFATVEVTSVDSSPEHAAVMGDSVGIALQIVLNTLTPTERVAVVLHDVFAVPFDVIARILDRSPEATRQLTSRARRRVQGSSDSEESGATQWPVVDAFFVAARHGDFEALVKLLEPELALHVVGEGGASSRVVGAEAVARRALLFADPERQTHPVLVNARPGVVVTGPDGRPVSLMSFTVKDGSILAIDALTDAARLDALHLPLQ